MINGNWGSVVSPIRYTSVPLTTTLSISLVQGWTWISLNNVPGDLLIATIFSGVSSLAAGDHLKNQFTFTDYYHGFGFYGQLASLTGDTMYAIKLATAATLSVTGMPATLPKTVTLTSGWSWLPLPYPSALALASASPSPVNAFAAGDQFKSQSEFAEFYDGYGWYGTLSQLNPGQGYKIKVATGGEATFQAQ